MNNSPTRNGVHGEELELPRIALPTNPQLQQAARALVAAKDALDDALRMPGLRALIPPEWETPNGQALEALQYVNRVLPFLKLDALQTSKARVPLEYLIGESWRWRQADASVGLQLDAEPLALYLASDARAACGARDAAEIWHIAPIGLCVTHEGKNRVRFLRDLGASDMAAAVVKLDYPAAERLQRYWLEANGRREDWCLLDGRWLRRIVLPQLTQPVLDAYGVRPSGPWPATLPKPTSESVRTTTSPPCPELREIDLELLRNRSEAETESNRWVPASAFDLVSVIRPRWRIVACWIAALLLVTIAGGAIGGLLGATVSSGALAALCGSAITCLGPWVRVKRRYLS